MKLIFDLGEDINRIKTGDTVLISGLYGKNFKFINNKCGKVKSIFTQISGNQVLALAYVKIFNVDTEYVINFDFLYKLNLAECIVDNFFQHVFTIENPLMYYIHKKKIKHTMNFQDEMGQCMGIGMDNSGKSHVLLFSGIN